MKPSALNEARRWRGEASKRLEEEEEGRKAVGPATYSDTLIRL
jgi:hypothetical protein